MNEDKCLYCGSGEFKEYNQGPDAVVFEKDKKIFKSRKSLNYEICTKCGTVKRIYINLER